MNRLLLITLLILSVSGFSQSGYYGSRSVIEAKMDFAPSVWTKAKFNSVTDELHNKRRFLYLNYNVNFAYTCTRKLELSTGIEYSKITSFIENTQWEPVWGSEVLGAPKLNFLAGKFEFKYYRQGSLAPIGKYFGLCVQLSRTWLADEVIHYGVIGSIQSSGFFNKTRNANEMGTDSLDGTQKMTALTLQVKWGRVTAITERISLVSGFSFPLASLFFNRYFDFPIWPSPIPTPSGGYELDESASSDWADLMSFAVTRQQGFSVELGFRFHL